MSVAGLVLVAGALVGGAIADARAVPHLERVLDDHLDNLTRGTPPDVEDEIAATLLALERLDPESALVRARSIMKARAGARLALVAHRVAARAGDVSAVRTALGRYFEDPEGWRVVLGAAAAANDDVRLRAFLDFAVLPPPRGHEWFRTSLLRFLGDELPRAVLPDKNVHESRGPATPTGAADAFAAMYQLHRGRRETLLPWLRSSDDETRERARFVMALSGDPRRLPLLIELAVAGSGAGRDAAFRALAETDLGDFDKRLHRLAGDPDRDVRFQTALALVPTGEAWALKLLVSELDEGDSIERQRARRALERLAAADAVALVETLLADGTATPFAIELYLDLTRGRGGSVTPRRLWDVLAPHVAAEDPTALLAAARLVVAEARAAVRRYLDRE